MCKCVIEIKGEKVNLIQTFYWTESHFYRGFLFWLMSLFALGKIKWKLDLW